MVKLGGNEKHVKYVKITFKFYEIREKFEKVGGKGQIGKISHGVWKFFGNRGNLKQRGNAPLPQRAWTSLVCWCRVFEMKPALLGEISNRRDVLFLSPVSVYLYISCSLPLDPVYVFFLFPASYTCMFASVLFLLSVSVYLSLSCSFSLSISLFPVPSTCLCLFVYFIFLLSVSFYLSLSSSFSLSLLVIFLLPVSICLPLLLRLYLCIPREKRLQNDVT